MTDYAWDFGLTPKMMMSVNLEKLNEELVENGRDDLVVDPNEAHLAAVHAVSPHDEFEVPTKVVDLMNALEESLKGFPRAANYDAEPVYLSLEGRD